MKLSAWARQEGIHYITAWRWWRDGKLPIPNAGCDGLATALKNFFASRNGTRRGKRVAFPTFKKRGRGRQSVRFTTGALRVVDRTHIQLPRIGVLRTHEPTMTLREQLAAGTARILSTTTSSDGDRWQVSFMCEVEREISQPARPGESIGADAGLRETVLSTGERTPSPKPFKKALKKIARLNRELARRKQGSHGWQETQRKLRRVHAHVRHIREDAMHKLTTRLAKSYGTVVAEHLGVNGMMRSKRISRAVADAAMAALRRQLGYKCLRYGSRFIAPHRSSRVRRRVPGAGRSKPRCLCGNGSSGVPGVGWRWIATSTPPRVWPHVRPRSSPGVVRRRNTPVEGT